MYTQNQETASHTPTAYSHSTTNTQSQPPSLMSTAEKGSLSNHHTRHNRQRILGLFIHYLYISLPVYFTWYY